MIVLFPCPGTRSRDHVLVQFIFFLAILLSLMAAVASGFSSSAHSNSNKHCAIVGVGVLGTSLCRQILEATDDWTVTGITQTTRNHDAIRKAMPADQVHRLTLTTREEVSSSFLTAEATDGTFPNVVFCAPPSGTADYPADVKDVVDNLWSGPDQGVFCFTSSAGIYNVESGVVTETTPIASMTPRTERLVLAEKAALEAGGCALRLAGLYLLERGAHSFYMKTDKPIQGNPDGLVNLLHYDDAASACWAAVKAGPKICQGQIFLISDGHPQTRRQICESTLKSAMYRDCTMPSFANEEPDPTQPGKTCDGSFSNKVLKWNPKYESFAKFMEDHT